MASGVFDVILTENFPACEKGQCVNQVLSKLSIKFSQARSICKYLTSFREVL